MKACKYLLREGVYKENVMWDSVKEKKSEINSLELQNEKIERFLIQNHYFKFLAEHDRKKLKELIDAGRELLNDVRPS